MPLVTAVTESIIAELLYLNYEDTTKPNTMHINSSGTATADKIFLFPTPVFLHNIFLYRLLVFSHNIHNRLKANMGSVSLFQMQLYC